MGVPIPVLVLWGLNGIPANMLLKNSCANVVVPQIALMKELLAANPTHTCGAIIERRACPGGLSRRTFHSAIYAALESKGVDCDTDLVLNFKEIARPNTFTHPLSFSNEQGPKAIEQMLQPIGMHPPLYLSNP